MNTPTDQQLLEDYAASRSELAFAELVRRHIDLVYSAALRMVRDTHSAKDVTQGVFVALSKNAGLLSSHPVLSGWLLRTAKNLAANAVRTEIRRRKREQKAAAVGFGIYEAQEASMARRNVEYLVADQKPLQLQLHAVRRERDEATTQLAQAVAGNELFRRNAAEVPKLRGELARARDDARERTRLKSSLGDDPALVAADKSWTARASKLKQRLEQMPDIKIPELQFLTEKTGSMRSNRGNHWNPRPTTDRR